MNKQEFFDRPDRCYFVPEVKWAAGYCKEHWNEEVAHILRVADEVCKQYFLFDLPWDMERTYEPVVFENEIDWCYTPNGDPEFVWQFNRHRYFICLGQAYHLTENEKYVQGFLHLINDWIDHVPCDDKTKSGPWRILETGLRGETWTKAIRYFKDSPLLTESFWDKFTEALKEHARRLVTQGSQARLQSNWSVLEKSGLFEIAMALPQSDETKEWAEHAIACMEEAILLQVYADGYQWEQSPMYHNEVYHCLCCVLYLAKVNGIEVSKHFQDTVHNMALCNLKFKKPDHSQFTQGDSDDTDLRDKIVMGAYLFQDPILKFGGYEILDFEGAWDFGKTAYEVYEAMNPMRPEFTSVSMEESGNYYLRESFAEDANLLHFTCGPMGTGHCHGDKLHIDLVINGEDVLVDGGRATYMDVPLRFVLKGNEGHNTTTVDGKGFTTFENSWSTDGLSLPINRKFFAGEIAEYVQGGHLGYIKEGVFVNRRVIWIKPDIYVINDEFYGKGTHTYQQFFHFAPEGTTTIQTEAFPSVLFEGKTNVAHFTMLTPNISLEAGRGVVSKHYNQSEENDKIMGTLEKDGFASMITVINGGARGEVEKAEVSLVDVYSQVLGTKLCENQAQAVKIKLGGETYMVVICHDEIFKGSDTFQAEQCFGIGNVCVFDLTGRENERINGGEVLHI